MKHSLLLLITSTLLLISCENWFCSEEENDENVQYKTLDSQIDGTLYFVAGPSMSEIDTTKESYTYENYWDFWKLDGNEFLKINTVPFDYDTRYWEFQWSPKGNYFSFFNDMGGEVPNTDDIGVMNPEILEEIYLTEKLGDANPGDQCVYNWSQDEEYVYFTALEYGISEYEEIANSDIYRIKPNGTGLEKLTDTPFFDSQVQLALEYLEWPRDVDHKIFQFSAEFQ